MLSPFLILDAWHQTVSNPTMSGLAAFEALESATDSDFSGWPDEGLPHPATCACPDCAGDLSPILEPNP